MGALWLSRLHLEVESFECAVKDTAAKIFVGALSLYVLEQAKLTEQRPETPTAQGPTGSC
jgi:hypothetical protein